MAIPKLKGRGTYKNNFIKTKAGNGLLYGEKYLWVKVESTKHYLTAILWKLENGRKKIMQIDQGDRDPETINALDTVRLEMFDRDGTPMDVGNYILEIRSDVGSRNNKQGTIEDAFCIYPTQAWLDNEGRGKQITLLGDDYVKDHYLT